MINKFVWGIEDLIWRFKMWRPHLCNCGHFCHFGMRKTEWMTTGRRVTFCPRCHRERFPFCREYKEKPNG